MSRRALLRGGIVAGAAFAVSPRLAGALTPAATAATRAADSTNRSPLDRRPAPKIISRARWGADESRRNGGVDYDAVVEKIVVHHTGTTNDVTDWADQVRLIYKFETASGYRDIAYHYLVDPDGHIYEGRWARDVPDDFAADAEDARGWLVRGGHALGHNPRTLGIALLGDYTKVEPTDAALEALVALLAWKCARWRVDPLGSSLYLNENHVLETLPNIVPHGQVRATECPGSNLQRLLPELRRRIADEIGSTSPRGGYRIVSRSGRDIAFGALPAIEGQIPANAAIAGVTTHAAGLGYWAFGSDGGVFAVGAAGFHGSLAGQRLNAPVVGLAAPSRADGYWLAASDGGVFAFGAAPFHGSVSGTQLSAPIVGIEATRSGLGYWCYAADGGVFAFGDAPYLGSLSNTRLLAPVVDMAATRDGYWLVGADGGLFAFGDAAFLGGGTTGSPIVAMTPTTTERGYVFLAADGQVLPFGDAPYYGSAAGMMLDAVGIAGLIEP